MTMIFDSWFRSIDKSWLDNTTTYKTNSVIDNEPDERPEKDEKKNN